MLNYNTHTHRHHLKAVPVINITSSIVLLPVLPFPQEFSNIFHSSKLCSNSIQISKFPIVRRDLFIMSFFLRKHTFYKFITVQHIMLHLSDAPLM